MSHIKITQKDWEAICALADIGIQDTVNSEDGSPKRSSHYRDYVQFRSCERRVNDQLNGNAQTKTRSNPDAVLPGQLPLFEVCS